MKTASRSASEVRRDAARDTGEEIPGSLLLAAAVLAFLLAASFGRAASLWPADNARGMLADHRASRIGDILTVVVSEIATASSAQTKSSTRDSTLEDPINSFLYPSAATGLLSHNGAMTISSGMR